MARKCRSSYPSRFPGKAGLVALGPKEPPTPPPVEVELAPPPPPPPAPPPPPSPAAASEKPEPRLAPVPAAAAKAAKLAGQAPVEPDAPVDLTGNTFVTG